MPFDSLTSNPTRTWSAIAAPPLAPKQTGEATACGAAPMAIQLSGLPNWVVLQVAEKLDNPAVLALSRTCRQMHAVLEAGLAKAARLSTRVDSIVSASGVLEVIPAIEALPTNLRPPLIRALTLQLAVLHPVLHGRVRDAVEALWHNDHRGRLEAKLDAERLGKRHIPCAIPVQLPPLEVILELPPAQRARLLVKWMPLAHGLDRGVTTYPLPRWEQAVAALPPSDARQVLCALIEHVNDVLNEEYWEATIELALSMAMGWGPPGNDQHVALLVAAGKATAANACQSPLKRRVWDKVLRLAQCLPEAQCRPVLVSLGHYPNIELCAGDFAPEELPPDTPAWKALRDTAFALLSEDGIADVLGAMAVGMDSTYASHVERRLPMLTDLVTKASRLPVDMCARVLEQVLMWETADGTGKFEPFWNAILDASRGTPPACQARVLPALAESLPTILENEKNDAEPTGPVRWHTLLSRTMALPEAMRLQAALRLVHSGANVPRLVDAGVELLALSKTLRSVDRAKLLAAMTTGSNGTEPVPAAIWPQLVSLIIELETEHRPTALAALIHRLMRGVSEGSFGAGMSAQIAGADMPLGQWPRDQAQALHQASAALQLLPQPKVVATLSDLVASRHRRDTKVLRWLLQEVQRIAAFDRAVLLTRICATLADRRTVDMDPLLVVDAEAAVRRLPPELRGSALHYLADAAAAWAGLDYVQLALRGQLATLPDADRLQTTPRKRKDAPA